MKQRPRLYSVSRSLTPVRQKPVELNGKIKEIPKIPDHLFLEGDEKEFLINALLKLKKSTGLPSEMLESKIFGQFIESVFSLG